MNRLLLFGALLAAPSLVQAQRWQWATAPTGTGNARIYATATDATGATVVAGDFTGSITLGPTTLTSVGNRDIFVARLTNAGTWTQAVRAGGTAEDYAIDLALTADGTATVLGGFYSPTAQFGSIALPRVGTSNSAEVFVAQLSSDGAWTRAVQGGSLAANYPSALALNAAGEAVVTGFFYGTSTAFGSTTLANSNPGGNTSDVFVARLSGAGAWTLATRAGSTGDDRAEDLVLEADGTALVVGSFQGLAMSVGNFSLANADATGRTNDVFVARMGRTGTWTQALRAGGAQADQARGVALDAAGNATVVGSFSSPAIGLGSFSLTNANSAGTSADIFAARLTPAGTWSQALRAGGTGSETALTLAVSADGAAAVGGLFSGPTTTFGNTPLANADASGSTTDLFVACLNSAGSAWTRAIRAGGPSNDAVVDLALTSTGEATIAGAFQTTTTIGPTVLVGNSATDDAGFLARTEGLPLGVRQAAGVTPLALYPNPAAVGAPAMLRLPTASATAVALTLRDALGRAVRTGLVPAGRQEASVSTAGLAPGLYLLEAGAQRAQLVLE